MSPFPLTTALFEESLKPADVKPLQIIYVSLAFGVTAAALVVVLSATQPAPASTQSPGASDLVRMFGAITGTATLIGSVLAFGGYRQILSNPQLRASGATPEDFLKAVKKASIVLLGVLEAVAFWGLAVCFLAGRFGLLYERPLYWWNLAPLAIMLAAVSRTFPTRDRVVALFKKHVARENI